jgi:hypothetical protein
MRRPRTTGLKAYLVDLGLWETEAAYHDAVWPERFERVCEMHAAVAPHCGMDFDAFVRFHARYAGVGPFEPG